MKKILFFSALTAVIMLAAFTKSAKYTFTDTITFTDTVKFSSASLVQDSTQTFARHAPYHYDTVQLSAGFMALDTSATADSVWLRFPSSPKNSQSVFISSVAAVTKCFYLNGTVNNANTTFAAGDAVGFTYLASTSKWYRRL